MAPGSASCHIRRHEIPSWFPQPRPGCRKPVAGVSRRSHHLPRGPAVSRLSGAFSHLAAVHLVARPAAGTIAAAASALLLISVTAGAGAEGGCSVPVAHAVLPLVLVGGDGEGGARSGHFLKTIHA